MAIFTRTREDEARFERFSQNVKRIIEQLKTGVEDRDILEVNRFLDAFENKISDFFSEERKLNIGIVGQVKAGKSSFLNTLLFEGQSVLPKASTPKTATLTKIEYAEENVMVVEYYNAEEWYEIADNAKVDSTEMEYESARELLKMARESGVNIDELLRAGTERIEFDDFSDLMARLNDYVGENGRFTALVKAVQLFVNNPLFQEISIVDTPGLNDPIVSRTLRTKEFIEVCDVVFFLTPCSAFLDRSDWTLLSTQLPQKGVKRLILAASKFDSGLRDVLRKADPEDIFGADPNTRDNIPEASELVQKKLTARTQMKISEFKEDLRERGADGEMIRVLDSCLKPLFVSAMCENMADRSLDSYNDEELNVYNALSEFSDNISAELGKIGNFDSVRKIQDEIVAEKEAILVERCAGFIPNACEELVWKLEDFRKRAEERKNFIFDKDRKQVIKKKDEIQIQINAIREKMQSALSEWLIKMETKKAEGVRELRGAAKESQELEERTGTETKTRSYQVKNSKWYKPWTWFRTRTEYYTYDSSYTYIAAADAASNIRQYSKDCENLIERAFSEVVNHNEMKRQLLKIVADNFDMSDDRYDAPLFRSEIENQISKITFPTVRIDYSDEINAISARFAGQIRDSRDQENLKNALANAVDKVLSSLIIGFEKAVAEYKKTLSGIIDELRNNLLKDMNAEFENILKLLDEKDAGIKRLTEYSAKLGSAISEVRGWAN